MAAVLSGIAASACGPSPASGGDAALFQLLSVKADGLTLTADPVRAGVPVDAEVVVSFSAAMDTASARAAISLAAVSDAGSPLALNLTFTDDNRVARLSPRVPLSHWSRYRITITDGLRGADRQPFPGISYLFDTENGTLALETATLNGTSIRTTATPRNVPVTGSVFELTFSDPLPDPLPTDVFRLSPTVPLQADLSPDRRTVTLSVQGSLRSYTRYTFSITSNLTSAQGFAFGGFSKVLISGLDASPKFPDLSDEALLDTVQRATFRYFWDFAHPVSGLARERNSSGETVTIGGSGFGVMGIVVGMHRGFITRSQGIERLRTIVDFLAEADRFHGVWPHWMNGSTGRTIAFSTKDNGGDLVETSFMAQGLLTARQYLDSGVAAEQELITRINALLDGIEWTWYTRGGQNTLYWHWSPNFGWDMNMRVQGYNEALITYVMASVSTTYRIDPAVYTEGWTRNGAFRNGRSFFGIPLPLGFDFGGPLFFSHYSFLGLDPRRISDTYTDYWTQNRNHTLINRAHVLANPYGHVGYGEDAWGLTASDEPSGYGVHEPTRDNGTISPTAALASMPYTPEESIRAMRHFRQVLGDRLWGPYGFYDAYNPTQGWWATSTLAIDQGPILIMLENHRSGLLWDLFMSAPEVVPGLERLGFTVQNPPTAKPRR